MLSGISGFKGVYSRDTLPVHMSENETVVINYDTDSGQGTHWVAAINIPGHDYVYFFDSFGIVPGDTIQSYLKTSGKQIMFSDAEIQQFDSVACGYYCVYVIKQLHKGVKFFNILMEFDNEPTDANEAKIRQIAQNL